MSSGEYVYVCISICLYSYRYYRYIYQFFIDLLKAFDWIPQKSGCFYEKNVSEFSAKFVKVLLLLGDDTTNRISIFSYLYH